MKQLDIVQVSAYYPPNLGGQENAVHDLATQLAGRGHRVRVISSSQGGGPRGLAKEDAVDVHRLRSFVFGHAPVMPRFLPLLIGQTRQKHTVVHLHIGQAFTPEMVWLASKLRGFAYVAQLHIDFMPSGPAGFLLPLYKKLVLRRVLRSAHTVVVLNKKMRDIVRNQFNYRGPVKLLPNGIDEAFFRIKRPKLAGAPPSTLRLLFVGRLSKQKNIPALLKALTITKRKVYLDLIGEGEELATVQRLVKAYGLTNVKLHGRLPRDEVKRFYETSDALIMPSLYEAQPLVLLEALAAKIPIIGTNVIGVAEHIKDAGIIVEPTAKALAAGIEQYDNLHGTPLSDMVARGRSLAKELRWSRTLKKYEALYDEIARH